MTAKPPGFDDLATFEDALSVQVHTATLAANSAAPVTLLELSSTASSPTAAALAVIYDLSDSCVATARLAARIPDLLRGWARDMPFWVFALSDDKLLPGISPGNIGHLLDGSIDLLAPFQDRRLADQFLLRASFLQPTLGAIQNMASEQGVQSVRIVVIGDGQMSDFSGVNLPGCIDLLALTENEEAARAATPAWTRVVGAAPLYSVDNPLLAEWFDARRDGTNFLRSLRVIASGQGLIRRIAADGVLIPIDQEWFDWDCRKGPLKLLAPTAAINGVTIEARLKTKVHSISGLRLAGAAPLSDTDRVTAELKVSERGSVVGELVFDTIRDRDIADQVWEAAATAFSRAQTFLSWTDPSLLKALLPNCPGVCATLCIANRIPSGVRTADDRLILLSLNSRRSTISWTKGDMLPIGPAGESWEIHYDFYEGRWILSRQANRETDQCALVKQNMHPTGGQRLPSLKTLDGREWVVAFSGPISRT